MHVRLKILHGSNIGKEVKIPVPKCVVGRADDCDLKPHSDAISRKHCEIITSESEVVVRDLKSRNGTFVNGDRVTDEALLLSGDILRVGPLEFEMLIEQTPGKAKRPKVADIKEAVARTAEGSGIAAAAELGEVGQWLEEADSEEKRRQASPETRQFRLDETVLPDDGPGKVAATVETKALPPDQKKSNKKKGPGKLPPRPKTTKENSRDAAADMLKKFFNRR